MWASVTREVGWSLDLPALYRLLNGGNYSASLERSREKGLIGKLVRIGQLTRRVIFPLQEYCLKR